MFIVAQGQPKQCLAWLLRVFLLMPLLMVLGIPEENSQHLGGCLCMSFCCQLEIGSRACVLTKVPSFDLKFTMHHRYQRYMSVCCIQVQFSSCLYRFLVLQPNSLMNVLLIWLVKFQILEIRVFNACYIIGQSYYRRKGL